MSENDERYFVVKNLYGSPSVPHPPQFNTSVPHKKITPFQPENPSVPHQKPLSSTHPLSSTSKTPQFHPPRQFHTENLSVPHTPQFNTKNPSVPRPQFNTKKSSIPHKKSSIEASCTVFFCQTENFRCGTEGGGVWTEGSLVRNWGVELKGIRFYTYFILYLDSRIPITIINKHKYFFLSKPDLLWNHAWLLTRVCERPSKTFRKNLSVTFLDFFSLISLSISRTLIETIVKTKNFHSVNL